MIRLRDIRFRDNSRYILNGANFEIEPGDRIGIVGANGSGKTTHCGIMMGPFGARIGRGGDFLAARESGSLTSQTCAGASVTCFRTRTTSYFAPRYWKTWLSAR